VVVEALFNQLRHVSVVLEATKTLGALAFVCPANARRFVELNAIEALQACRERHIKTEAVVLEVR
jgi:hypothetical protein